MPELPDITVYVESLARRVVDHPLQRVRLASPFLLRTVDPPLSSIYEHPVRSVRRMGKRIVFEFDQDYFLLLHLMITGRLHWKAARAALPGKVGLASFDFPHGSLHLTEAGTKRRASLHLVHGDDGLRALDAGGLEPLTADAPAFRDRLLRENRTLKRALTDPRLFSGIGNAYSDEILHRARLSPIVMTRKLTDEEHVRLYQATGTVLRKWIERLRAETGDGFPEKVTAFREDMAVHGKFRQPCPACRTPIQRIVYAENEANYCPTCQTGGRLLADRALSRLLGRDWPKTLDELELARRVKTL